PPRPARRGRGPRAAAGGRRLRRALLDRSRPRVVGAPPPVDDAAAGRPVRIRRVRARALLEPDSRGALLVSGARRTPTAESSARAAQYPRSRVADGLA